MRSIPVVLKNKLSGGAKRFWLSAGVSVLFFLITQGVFAQELNCNVQINSSKIQGTNKSVFNTLQKSMSEFLNTRHWSDMSVATSERIECTLIVTVNSVNDNSFTCDLQVQSRRPVYNSSYKTTLLNFKDNSFNFDYKEFDQLELNESSITSNLTAVLAYYAYLIIGFDQDSFSRLGGSPYFHAAENIVNAAQSADLSGWKAFESSKNRYAMINNITDEAFKKFREYFYEYHRFGLDIMSENVANGRDKILGGLPIVRDANRSRPSAVLVSAFIDAKNDELINILSQAGSKEKADAVEVLSDINPAYSSNYESILKN